MTTRSATSRPGGRPAPAGELLRHWRHQRRRSQLDLALDAGVSARHLSFVETGRARPSSGLLLALAEQLDLPLRERNALLLAAGYAPAYTETDLGGAQARAVRASLEHLLAGHEPYPAAVFDRWGDVVLTNRAVGPLLEGADPVLLGPPVNVYRLGLHPGGLAPRIRDRAGWTAHLVHRLTRLERLSGDRRLTALLAEVRGYPGVPEALAAAEAESAGAELLLTVQLTSSLGDLQLHSTVTSFGSPHDVTLAELAVESFFPADDRTRERLRAAAAGPAQEPLHPVLPAGPGGAVPVPGRPAVPGPAGPVGTGDGTGAHLDVATRPRRVTGPVDRAAGPADPRYA